MLIVYLHTLIVRDVYSRFQLPLSWVKLSVGFLSIADCSNVVNRASMASDLAACQARAYQLKVHLWQVNN